MLEALFAGSSFTFCSLSSIRHCCCFWSLHFTSNQHLAYSLAAVEPYYFISNIEKANDQFHSFFLLKSCWEIRAAKLEKETGKGWHGKFGEMTSSSTLYIPNCRTVAQSLSSYRLRQMRVPEVRRKWGKNRREEGRAVQDRVSEENEQLDKRRRKRKKKVDNFN